MPCTPLGSAIVARPIAIPPISNNTAAADWSHGWLDVHHRLGLAGGNGGDKAADLSGSPRFEELIRLATPHFDWIIVDSSPVLPVSDAVNLARACDGVLLVARSGETKFHVAQRAQSELKASNILGFVLNAVQEAPQVGSYYGYDAAKP